MLENSLINPLLTRKLSHYSKIIFFVLVLFTALTWQYDTRIIHFDLQSYELAKSIYALPVFGKILYKAYAYVISDYILNKLIEGFIIGFILAHVIVNRLVVKADDEEVLRGTMIVSPKELRNLIIKSGEKARLFLSKAKIPVPIHDENRSFLIVGKPGSGKTQVILGILKQIFKFGDTIIMYDRKPDFWVRFYQEDRDILFYPKDKRTLKWNIFNDLRNDDHIDFAVQSMIPENPEAKDPYWDNASRDILKTVLFYVRDQGNPSNKKLIDFLRTYKQPNELWKVLKQTSIDYATNIDMHLATKETSKNVLANLNSHVNGILRKEFYYDDGDFSVYDYIDNIDTKYKGNHLFLVHTANESGTYEIYFRLFIDLSTRRILGLPNSTQRRIWTILDEFQTLGKLTQIEELGAEGRSKGSSILLATQSLAKVEEIYEKKTMRSFFQLMSNKIILQYDEPEGGKFLADYIGEQEVEESLHNRMVTREGNRDISQIQRRNNTKKVVLAGEFANLDPLTAFIKISNFPLSKVEFKYLDIAEIEKLDPKEFSKFDPVKKEFPNESLGESTEDNRKREYEERTPDYFYDKKTQDLIPVYMDGERDKQEVRPGTRIVHDKEAERDEDQNMSDSLFSARTMQ